MRPCWLTVIVVDLWCAGGEGHQWAEWTLAAELRCLAVSLFGSASGGSGAEGSLSFRSGRQSLPFGHHGSKCPLTWTVEHARDAATSKSHEVNTRNTRFYFWSSVSVLLLSLITFFAAPCKGHILPLLRKPLCSCLYKTLQFCRL